MLVVTNAAKVRFAERLRDGGSPPDAFDSQTRLHLFQNNHTPDPADDLTDYTEATFSGYASILLDTWGAAFLNGDDKGETDEVNRTFSCTGASPANDIYGYYVTDASSTILLWAELNPAGPVTLDGAGQTYTVLPRFTLTNESEV